MFNNSYNSSSELWNKGNNVMTENNNTVYKTIYSPSPSYYEEPKTASCSGFSINGTFNNGTGYYFYCQPDHTGGTIFFAALCSISGGTIDWPHKYGHYWFAGPASSSGGATIGFDANALFLYADRSKTSGFSLRPILE